MSRYYIEKATEKDNEELCRLCTIPLQGNILLSLERAPDFFAGSKIQSEQAATYVCRKKDTNQIIAVFSVGRRRVFYKKEISYTGYLSDLRIHPDTQGSGVFYRICRFISDHLILENDIVQTIVFSDNNVVLDLIDPLKHISIKKTIFKFSGAGNYVSYLVKFSNNVKSRRTRYLVRKAETKDIPQMQELLLEEGPKKEFFPYYDFTSLDNVYYAGLTINHFYLAFDDGKLTGITGIWDQHTIKQTKVYGYSFRYQLLRPLINLYSLLSKDFLLPAAGTVLHYFTLHTIVIKNNDNAIFDSLLEQINNDYQNMHYTYFLIGLDEKDTLNKSLEAFGTKRKIKGKHFLVATKYISDQKLLNSNYYLEAARI